jgi:hypothetical protein
MGVASWVGWGDPAQRYDAARADGRRGIIGRVNLAAAVESG